MMSSTSQSSAVDRLLRACLDGDLPSAAAAVSDGASVNEKRGVWLPLTTSLYRKRDDIAVWLLSHGADPNGSDVMFRGAAFSTPDLLQLLIDAGGSVNGESGREPPLFWTVFNSREDNGRVLLAQPAFDFYLQYEGRAPEQFARNRGESALADVIVQEVSRGLPTPHHNLISHRRRRRRCHHPPPFMYYRRH